VKKSDAEKYEREILTALEKGFWTSPDLGKITLSEVNAQFMKSLTNLKPKSKESMDSLWRYHIEPKFGDWQLAKISSNEIRKWVLSAVDGPNSYTSSGRIKRALEQLSRILDFAVDSNYIPKNSARGSNGKVLKISIPNSDTGRPTCSLESHELIKLAKACGRYEGLVLLAGIMGLRWAEIVGLQVQDVDLKSRNLVVRRSLSELSGKFYETTTKTGSIRSLVIPEFLVPYLEKAIVGKDDTALVFSNRSGLPLHNANFKQRIYNPALKKCGLPKITFHDLRHTAASIALLNGVKLLNVSEMLGHSDKALTLRKYSHLLPGEQKKTASILDSIYLDSEVSV
jgi:integrase